METLDPQLVQGAFAILVTVLGYFLKQKDEKHEKEIELLKNKQSSDAALLWAKHDQDAKDLSELRLHIASQHYVKTELDSRFDKMEMAFTNGFHELSGKMDKMIDAIIDKNL